MPEVTKSAPCWKEGGSGRPTGQSAPALGSRASVQVQVRLDVGQPLGVPPAPVTAAPQLARCPQASEAQGERHGFCPRGCPLPTRAPRTVQGRISAPLHASRPGGGRGGRHSHLTWPPARTDSGPWVPLDPHVPSHVNARNTHQGTGATQHRQTRGSGRSDVTLGGCSCPATPRGDPSQLSAFPWVSPGFRPEQLRPRSPCPLSLQGALVPRHPPQESPLGVRPGGRHLPRGPLRHSGLHRESRGRDPQVAGCGRRTKEVEDSVQARTPTAGTRSCTRVCGRLPQQRMQAGVPGQGACGRRQPWREPGGLRNRNRNRNRNGVGRRGPS